ncbi:hypothetical protein EDD16DRAFT_1708470 [Pisolithus croceorrhizus]|nr:hypothetical protein EDD16DRAFT_1708470 [Pisolithus croceorrhizus]KAI6139076.1 hypothetical protein EDD17DRAFT_1770688 [Pisolithus thermaeus]
MLSQLLFGILGHVFDIFSILFDSTRQPKSPPTLSTKLYTVVLHKQSFTPEIASAALPFPKVLLQEVDHSNALCTQVYGLRKNLYHQVANFNILEGKFCQKEGGLSNLEEQIRGKDVVIAEQAQLLSQLRQGLKEVKQQTAAQGLVLAQAGLKDAIIAQQSEALQKLQ